MLEFGRIEVSSDLLDKVLKIESLKGDDNG